MSDETELTGQAYDEFRQGYSPLPEEKRPEEETFGSDDDGLRAAASALEDTRESARDQGVEIERIYHEPDGSVAEDKRTVKLNRASDDLADSRRQESAAEDAEAATALVERVDAARMKAQAEALGIDLNAQQPQAQQAQTSEETPSPSEANERSRRAMGTEEQPIEKELSEVLERHPRVKQALQQEVAELERHKSAFVQASDQAARLAASAFMQQFPELQGLTAEQLPVAVSMIQKGNPQRGAEIVRAAQNVQNIYYQSQAAQAQAQQQQRQVAAQQFGQWTDQQDAQFEQWAAKPENSARVSAVKANAAQLVESEYGISRSDLAQLYNSQPLLRSAVGQQILADALSFRQAMKTATSNPASRSAVPPVQRPGASSDRQFAGDESYPSRARRKVQQKPP